MSVTVNTSKDPDRFIYLFDSSVWNFPTLFDACVCVCMWF